MTTGFREFEFNLPEALLASMVATFDVMERAALTHENIRQIPDAQGVYLLLVGEDIVYIGKTDSEAGLLKRLGRHAFAIQHRSNLNVADVAFKAIRVFVFTAIDLETQLIKHYKGKSSISWNNSGFGSNDPGRNRDKTEDKPTGFDALYPIDLDQSVALPLSGKTLVTDALNSLRRTLPYTLRIQAAAPKSRVPHPDLAISAVTLPEEPISVRKLLTGIVATLPTGWQATALASRIILYKEHEDHYPGGRIIARS